MPRQQPGRYHHPSIKLTTIKTTTNANVHTLCFKGKRRWVLLLLCFVISVLWIIKHISLLSATLLHSRQKQKGPSNPPPSAYTFWSSDFHIAPIKDVKQLFHEWNATRHHVIIDESLSGQCHIDGGTTCANTTALKVLNKTNGITLGSCPNELKREFWWTYRDDERMTTVDAFFVQHATGLCEVFMAFGRPMIVAVSTRYEIGRWTSEAWKRLNDNLRAIATNPRNTIVANNLYDAEYLMHFSGLSNVKVLPNYCGYTNATYNPSRPQVLIGPGRLSFGAQLLVSGPNGIMAAAQNSTILRGTPFKEFATIRQLYERYEFADLAAHPAIVLIPYQASFMSFFEYYRMGIPLFVPSIDLLTRWQERATVVSEISWNCVHGRCHDKSSIPGHLSSPHGNKDPNDLGNFRYWIQFADYYQFPHITHFDSVQDLFEKLSTINLSDTHRRMMTYNRKQKEMLQRDWYEILNRTFQGRPPRASSLVNPSFVEKVEISWEDAVLRHYPNVSEHVRAKC